MSWLAATIDALAVYRLTRLATLDVIGDPIRERIIAAAYDRADTRTRRRGNGLLHTITAGQPDAPDRWQQVVEQDDDPPKLATLVTCRWCAGVWVGAGAWLLRRYLPRVWAAVAEVSAWSAAAALLAGLEDD